MAAGDALPEVAFAGRSNVGKSSLLNSLVRRKAFARVSNTPGRTREINFFKRERRVRARRPSGLRLRADLQGEESRVAAAHRELPEADYRSFGA